MATANERSQIAPLASFQLATTAGLGRIGGSLASRSIWRRSHRCASASASSPSPTSTWCIGLDAIGLPVSANVAAIVRPNAYSQTPRAMPA